MKYADIAKARSVDGLRLVLSVQSPGPWGIAARALFDIRKVPFLPVRQDVFAPNDDLVEWTGRRNAPVAIYNDEPAVDGWLEILNLAERLGSGPSLLPQDYARRVLAIGFSAEICGAGGFGWSRRITSLASAAKSPLVSGGVAATAMRQYGMVADGVEEAVQRSMAILRGLAAQLHRQRDEGSPYLVGGSLSACDVHWAAFSLLIEPLAQEDCELDDHLRAAFVAMPDEMRETIDPILIEHRDLVWRNHIGLPLDYLPEE